MWPSALARVASYNSSFEGFIRHMYLDVEGLVTVGVGNLLATPAAAAALPFTHDLNGGLASAGEKTAAWAAVKAAPPGKPVSTNGGDIYGALTDLRLNDAAINALVLAKSVSLDGFNMVEFPQKYPTFPADAQLGLIGVQWGGAWFTFPKLKAHVTKGEWFGAARECFFDETGQGGKKPNPGVKPRNISNRWLFSLAGRVVGMGLPVETLYLDNPGANKLYLFKGGNYVRYDWDSKKVDTNVDYPKPLSGWSLPMDLLSGVDAVFNGLGAYKVPKYYGKTYFFRGPKYARYDWDTDTVDVFDQNITNWGLTGEFAQGIDTALEGRGEYFGKLYFFKGGKYVRFNWLTDTVDQQARDINGPGGWDLPGTFASGIDAVANGEGPDSGKLYFFKGSKYVECRWKPYAVLSGPKDIAAKWADLANDKYKFASNIGATVGGPGCRPDLQS